MTKQVLKNHQSQKWSIAAKSLLISMVLLLTFTTLSFAKGGGRYLPTPITKVGIMADTQWTVGDDPEGKNPNSVSAALAGVIQQELVDKGVELVIQLGDLSDLAGDDAVYARADTAQPLIDAGIGFWPLRGNHETYGFLFGNDPNHDMDLPAFRDAYPQLTGQGNLLGAANVSNPSDVYGDDLSILDGLSYSFDYGPPGSNARFVIVDVEQTVYSEVFPEPHPLYGTPYTYVFFTVYQVDFPVEGVTDVYNSAAVAVEVDKEITIEPGTWFRIDSSGNPSTNMYAWDMVNPDQTSGYDYYFPYDVWVVPQEPSWSAAGTEYWPGSQQDWIDERLDMATRGTEHAFVLSHRGLMGTNHVDCFFGSNPGSKSSTQNPFYASLADNGVKYMLSGHDHLHNRALVDSPDGLSQVEQIIHMAASTKFYGPASLNSFTGAYGPVKQRETEISQELYNVGYYVMTIAGPRAIVDYYADADDGFQDNEDYPYGPDDPENPPLFLPELNFVLRESYGYSNNGQQYLVAQGDPYTVVQETYGNTTARILDGTNASTATDATPEVIDGEGITQSAPRALMKTVNTGWVDNPGDSVKSDIFFLIGMGELGPTPDKTDTIVLEMSTGERFPYSYIWPHKIGIATYVNGEWVNAVSENFGGTPTFVLGPYQAGYGLGTYGFDPFTRTFWAVLNYNADFAIALVDRI
jgi:hypothetical protein